MKDVIQQAIDLLKREQASIWLEEPEDVKHMREGKVRGAFESFSPGLLYAESETREACEYLWYFARAVEALTESTGAQVDALKKLIARIIDLKQDKWTRWYKMSHLPSLMRTASQAILACETKEEILAVLEPLQIVVGKYNFWFDNCIPWMTVAYTLDYVMGSSRK